MATYMIHIAAPGITVVMDPDRIPGAPKTLIVEMQDLLHAIDRATEAELLDAAVLATNGATKVLAEDSETCVSLIHRIVEGGLDYMREMCIVRAIRSRIEEGGDTAATPSTWLATSPGALGSASRTMHRLALQQIRTKLATLHLEVSEALAALDGCLSVETVSLVPEAGAAPYRSLPSEVIDALLHLGRLDGSSLSSRGGVFDVRDILSPEQRNALQTITHELQKSDDGLGHTVQDSTAANLMREFEGATAGDKHESMMAMAFGASSEHPELEPHKGESKPGVQE